MATRNLRDAVMRLMDNVAESVEVVLDGGDLEFTEVVQNQIEIDDRGTYDHSRKGNEAVVEMSFSTKLVSFKGVSGGAPDIHDILSHQGEAATWVSTGGTVAPDLYCIKVQFDIVNPVNAALSERITFARFAPGPLKFQEGDNFDTLSCSGKDNEIRATIDWVDLT